MEAILKPFVWGTNRHKLPWRTLKNPTDLRSVALPDFNLYYIVAQLSQLYPIDKTDGVRFAMFLCPAWSKNVL